MNFQARADEITSRYNVKPTTVTIVNEIPCSRKNSLILGQTNVIRRTILIRERDSDSMTETLHHELAHVLAFSFYYDTSHGPVWKRYARQLNSIPRARIGTLLQEALKADAKKASKAARAKARRSRKIAT